MSSVDAVRDKSESFVSDTPASQKGNGRIKDTIKRRFPDECSVVAPPLKSSYLLRRANRPRNETSTEKGGAAPLPVLNFAVCEKKIMRGAKTSAGSKYTPPPGEIWGARHTSRARQNEYFWVYFRRPLLSQPHICAPLAGSYLF